MRGFLVSSGIHAAAIAGVLLLPWFSASELPPIPNRDPVYYDPVVPRAVLRLEKPPLPARRQSRGGGGAIAGPELPRQPQGPPVISEDPLSPGADDRGGDPTLPPGPGAEPVGELLPGPPIAVQTAPELVRAYLDVRPPRKLAGADPVYPALARVTHTEGTVALECTIDSDGHVSNLRVVRSHPLFDAAALEAVSTWRYAPTLLRGVPVAVLMTVTVEFRMKR